MKRVQPGLHIAEATCAKPDAISVDPMEANPALRWIRQVTDPTFKPHGLIARTMPVRTIRPQPMGRHGLVTPWELPSRSMKVKCMNNNSGRIQALAVGLTGRRSSGRGIRVLLGHELTVVAGAGTSSTGSSGRCTCANRCNRRCSNDT